MFLILYKAIEEQTKDMQLTTTTVTSTRPYFQSVRIFENIKPSNLEGSAVLYGLSFSVSATARESVQMAHECTFYIDDGRTFAFRGSKRNVVKRWTQLKIAHRNYCHNFLEDA